MSHKSQAAADALASKSKSKSKRPHSLHIRRAKNGFIVEQNHEDGSPPVTHIMPDAKSLMAHVGQTMGDEAEPMDNPQEEAQEKA